MAVRRLGAKVPGFTASIPQQVPVDAAAQQNDTVEASTHSEERGNVQKWDYVHNNESAHEMQCHEHCSVYGTPHTALELNVDDVNWDSVIALVDCLPSTM